MNISFKKCIYKGIEEVKLYEAVLPDDVLFFECVHTDCESVHWGGFRHYMGISRDVAFFKDIDYENLYYDFTIFGDLVFIMLHNVVLKSIDRTRILSREDVHAAFNLRDYIIIRWRKESHKFISAYRLNNVYGDACFMVSGIEVDGDGYFNSDFTKSLKHNEVKHLGQFVNHYRSHTISVIKNAKQCPYAEDLYYSVIDYVYATLSSFNSRHNAGPKPPMIWYDIDLPYCMRTYDDPKIQDEMIKYINLDKKLPVKEL